MEINEKTMEQILAGIKDLQESMVTLKSLVQDNSDRIDSLEIRQGRFENRMVERLQSYETRMAAVEEGVLILHAGQNTIKGQLSNMQLALDTGKDKWDVLSAAYVRSNDRIKKLESPRDNPRED